MQQERSAGTSRRVLLGARSRRLAVAVGAALLLAPMGAAPASSAPAGQSPLSQLRGQTSAAADDLGVRDADAEAAAARLNDVRQQVAVAQGTLDSANSQLSAARGDLVTKQTALAVAQSAQLSAQQRVDAATATLNTARDQLRVMMRSALQSGIGGDLDALMTSGTPNDLADRMGILAHLSSARQQHIDSLATAQAAVVDQEHQLDLARQRSADTVAAADAQVVRVASLVDGARVARQRLVDLQTQRQAALNQATVAAAAAQTRYAALQQASANLTTLLAARAQAHPGGPARPVPGRGGLIMPTTGVFTSPFGYRTDPLGRGTRFHAGQDIGAAMGTPILAATAGTVAYAGWESGYGNYTCIDRGSGFATCYGHQSKIMVSVGQVVTQGQQIGLVGSTGNSTGPHLHFEVRLNGVPVDPMPYLP
jgi:murein DD-endopeptidase MepM/ murein hydrolase activator NlpD